MLFNSIAFAVFLPLVFALYWLLGAGRVRLQNAFLIVASYVFYGWWDWRFLGLIFISSLTDYLIGRAMDRTEAASRRKMLLGVSLVVNLGFLGFFKYFDFFVTSLASLLESVGLEANLPLLRLILPVGISFYTFQTLSYTIDIYRKKIHSTSDGIAFFAFVSFFPQLVAGPIERAKSLLPQFTRARVFDPDLARAGLRQALWGFFKKMVVADNMAPYVEDIFSNAGQYDGVILVMGVFFFTLQVYCDFSGYSDIAIGVARLFGFGLMRNFAFPFFSRDIAEFWRRWHISLSTWFRDYVFIPLGGSRASRGRHIANVIITFTASGFWHGADWTFVLWGTLNGFYYVPLMLRNKQKQYTDTVAEGRVLPSPGDAMRMLGTFALVLLGLAIFRSETMGDAVFFLARIVRAPYQGLDYLAYGVPLIYAMIPLIVEWPLRTRQHGLDIGDIPVILRWTIYLAVILAIVVFGRFGSQQFIYFQF
jgi:D-alanyl-lipoteichoic acid acyltransferase DltB (MBOAT superfamily)